MSESESEGEGHEFGMVKSNRARVGSSPGHLPYQATATSSYPHSADTGEDGAWNIFDESLVLISIVMAAANTGFPVSFLRLLRLLRLMKVRPA